MLTHTHSQPGLGFGGRAEIYIASLLWMLMHKSGEFIPLCLSAISCCCCCQEPQKLYHDKLVNATTIIVIIIIFSLSNIISIVIVIVIGLAGGILSYPNSHLTPFAAEPGPSLTAPVYWSHFSSQRLRWWWLWWWSSWQWWSYATFIVIHIKITCQLSTISMLIYISMHTHTITLTHMQLCGQEVCVL